MIRVYVIGSLISVSLDLRKVVYVLLFSFDLFYYSLSLALV